MKPRAPLPATAAALALAITAALLLSSCHHGVYHQRYVHPHIATAHAHTPYHYGPPTKPGQTWHRKLKQGKKWPYHHHTTAEHLYQGPRDYRLRTSW